MYMEIRNELADFRVESIDFIFLINGQERIM